MRTLHYQLFAVIDPSCVGEKTFRVGQFLGDLYTVRQFQTFGIKRVLVMQRTVLITQFPKVIYR